MVQQLAHQCQCQPEALNVSLRSVINLNPGSTLAVFGNDEANLRLGLETLMAMLNSINSSSHQGADAELTRYTLSMMVLERKLSGNKSAMATLAHYELGSETITSAMAGIYIDVISPVRSAHSGDRLAYCVPEPAAGELGARRRAVAAGRRRPLSADVVAPAPAARGENHFIPALSGLLSRPEPYC